MATSKETIEHILNELHSPKVFTARAMFGEYALYASGTVVALVCDDQLYVKIVPESQMLESICEQGSPYPGAKPHYVVEERQLAQLDELPDILKAIAKGRKKKPIKGKGSKRKNRRPSR